MRETVLEKGVGISIDIRGVTRRFEGGVTALENFSLSVPAGEFLAILGPSGCGKSTLLRLIAQLDRPQAGTIQVGAGERAAQAYGATGGGGIREGEAPAEPKIARKTRLGRSLALPSQPGGDCLEMAYVFQDAHLLPWRTVLSNAALPLELAGFARGERMDAAQKALEMVGLSDAMDRYPAQLSGGMRMRVSLARAMVTRPRLLLLDEPFAALDEITRQRLDEQLRELWTASGMTVVFVTHSTAEAVYLAQRAVVLSPRPGRIIYDGRIELPEERPAALRAAPEFAAQTRAIYGSLGRGGQ